eukprot:5354013-Prymnesium_polylepis.1
MSRSRRAASSKHPRCGRGRAGRVQAGDGAAMAAMASGGDGGAALRVGQPMASDAKSLAI